jgi:O-acetyl-ADP-ribose deacetylase (regulator of RNase III)
MIYKKGNIIHASEKIIAHGTNQQGKMMSGVAKAIREYFPGVFEAYRAEYDTKGLLLGTVVFVESKNKIIANCITQQFYGRDGRRYVDYNAIAESMKKIKLYCIENGITEVALPRIGSGLGGGNWEEISAIVMANLDPVIPVIYDLQ